MNPLLYIAIFVATVLALEAVYILVLERRADQATVKRRLRAVAANIQADPRDGDESSILRRDERSVLDTLFERLPGSGTLSLRLYRAGLAISPERFLLLCAAMALGAWVLASVFVTDPRSALPFLAFGVVPLLQVARLARKRMRAFEEQFPQALELLTRALRAGNSLTFGLQMVGEEMPDPVGTEFAQVAEEIKLGKSVRSALDNLAHRVDAPDLPFFVTAVSIQTQTGGNLAEILDNLGYVIRERFKLYGKVRALTAIGRLSANLLAVWPIVMVGVLFLVNPGYVEPLWKSDAGPIMVMISVALVVVGYVICRRMAMIKV